MAIAVTDRAGRLVCASDLFGEWFPGFPTPPNLTAEPGLTESLSAAARAAWRDGEARVEGVAQGALRLDVDLCRTGRSEDYLLWRFTPVRQPNALDDVHRDARVDEAQLSCHAPSTERRALGLTGSRNSHPDPELRVGISGGAVS